MRVRARARAKGARTPWLLPRAAAPLALRERVVAWSVVRCVGSASREGRGGVGSRLLARSLALRGGGPEHAPSLLGFAGARSKRGAGLQASRRWLLRDSRGARVSPTMAMRQQSHSTSEMSTNVVSHGARRLAGRESNWLLELVSPCGRDRRGRATSRRRRRNISRSPSSTMVRSSAQALTIPNCVDSATRDMLRASLVAGMQPNAPGRHARVSRARARGGLIPSVGE